MLPLEVALLGFHGGRWSSSAAVVSSLGLALPLPLSLVFKPFLVAVSSHSARFGPWLAVCSSFLLLSLRLTIA